MINPYVIINLVLISKLIIIVDRSDDYIYIHPLNYVIGMLLRIQIIYLLLNIHKYKKKINTIIIFLSNQRKEYLLS
jgi:hypothetical protein